MDYIQHSSSALKRSACTLLVSLSLVLAGCSSGTATRYYMLSADTPGSPSASASAPLVLGVGPVTIPDYLDRAELVFQSSPNRFEIPTEHRWTGSLQEDIQRVVGSNLAGRFGTSALHFYPWDRRLQCDVTVSLAVIQFHSISGEDAILEANWRIQRRAKDGEPESALQGHLVFREPLKGDGYEAVVAAQSRLLSRVAAELAEKARGS